MTEPSDHFEFWTPSRRGEHAADDPLNLAIQDVGSMPRAEANRMIEQLIFMGQHYEAARCLELMAQQSLGVVTLASDLVGSNQPEFGLFHEDIRALMRAGALYHRSSRPGTSWATFQRALIFVEEALRNLSEFEIDNPADACCVGLAFELAGHCCAAIDNVDGLEYYKAAHAYWDQSAAANPDASRSWQDHKVTQTVIASIEPVVVVKPLEPSLRISLFTTDYQTRLDTAKALLR